MTESTTADSPHASSPEPEEASSAEERAGAETDATEEGGEQVGQTSTEAADSESCESPLAVALAALQSEKQDTWDRLLRTAAEFENYKKRSRRDIADAGRRAEDRVVLDFLPVVDDLERALAHGDEQAGPLTEGVQLVHKQFLKTLAKYSIEPFDSIGQRFDPEHHEAIQQMPSEQPPGHVIHELQRGYRRKERLVRPAMVVVSSGPADGQQAAASADGEAEGEE